MTRPLAAALAVVAILGGAAPAASQTAAPALRTGQVVVGLGAARVGRDTLGSATAETRRVALGTLTPPPFTLFDTTSQLDAAVAAELTVAVALRPAWALEVRGGRGRPTLTTTISGDPEASGTFTATEPVAEYTVDASVLYHPGWAGLGSRARGYLLAGGGYLRQLHDDDALVVTGATAHAGAGVRLWLAGGRGGRRAAGLVGEARWIVRRDGITVADDVRSVPAFALRAFVGF